MLSITTWAVPRFAVIHRICQPFPLVLIVLKTTLRRHLEQIYPSRELASWFDPLGVDIDREGRSVRISFPHPLFRQWFMGTIRPAFEEHARAVAQGLRFEYQDDAPEGAAAPPLRQTVAAPSSPALPSGRSLFPGQTAKASFSKAPARPKSEGFIPALLGRYNFEDFLVNRKNDFPVAAAKEAVARAANPLYTPLIIYGQSGSGKTHLLGAMANALLSEQPDLPFFYGNADMLQTRVLPGTLVPLDEKVVFMDDAERISSNRQLQDELILVVDMFRAENRLLVLAFDTHPVSCPGLCQKLLSRLNGGLVLELKKPDIDIRRQYVQQKNFQFELGLSREQILSLAQRYQDFRTIDGALTRLKAYRTLVDRPETDFAGILGTGGEQKVLTPAGIIAHASTLFSVSAEDISGKSRDKKASLARQLSMYLCRELLGLSLAQVGHFFGGRDHSSVHYTIKKVIELQQSNKDMNKYLAELKQLCLSGPS